MSLVLRHLMLSMLSLCYFSWRNTNNSRPNLNEKKMIPSSLWWINNIIRITYRDGSEGWMRVCIRQAFMNMAQRQMCHQKASSSLGASSWELHLWRCHQRKQATPQAKDSPLFPGVFCFGLVFLFTLEKPCEYGKCYGLPETC